MEPQKPKLQFLVQNVIDYYKDISPWKMDGVQVEVVDNNEHLGQVISGFQQESKNVDNRLTKGRKSIWTAWCCICI